MSSREPLWFCHECHTEMRPLMTPDPVCASCRSSFVERLENPSDDPRDFQHNIPDDFDDPHFRQMDDDNMLRGIRNALAPQSDVFAPSSPPPAPSRTLDGGMGGGGLRFEIHSRPGRSTRTVFIGGSNTLGRSSNQTETNVPTMTEFLRHDDGVINGELMAQYLLAIFARDPTGRHTEPFADLLGQGDRWGDYVFNQEALDRIMTQLMENSTAGRPVPVTDDILFKLHRDVLEEGSHLLEKDCAICKEQFTLHPEDDGELIIVTLPCDHPFHEDCILPWLKSSGTCPVCRYQLVAQPQPPGGPGQNSHGSPPTQPPPQPPRQSRSPTSSRQNSGGGGGGGGSFFQSLFGGAGGSSSGRNGYSSRGSVDNSRDSPYFPGHWTDGID